jgi:hypothetical protein
VRCVAPLSPERDRAAWPTPPPRCRPPPPAASLASVPSPPFPFTPLIHLSFLFLSTQPCLFQPLQAPPTYTPSSFCSLSDRRRARAPDGNRKEGLGWREVTAGPDHPITNLPPPHTIRLPPRAPSQTGRPHQRPERRRRVRRARRGNQAGRFHYALIPSRAAGASSRCSLLAAARAPCPVRPEDLVPLILRREPRVARLAIVEGPKRCGFSHRSVMSKVTASVTSVMVSDVGSRWAARGGCGGRGKGTGTRTGTGIGTGRRGRVTGLHGLVCMCE